jgi:PKD repeat protein
MIYVTGGSSDDSVYDTLYKYDPVNDSWTQLESMISPRRFHGTAVLDGKIYVYGGHDETEFLDSTEVYDPQTDTWTALAPMKKKRYDFASVSYDGKLYAFGGNSLDNWSSPYLQDIEVYNPSAGTWEPDTHLLNIARQGLRAVWKESNNNIYVLGGYNGGPDSLGTNETLNKDNTPSTDTTISITSLTALPSSAGLAPLEVFVKVMASGGSGSYNYLWDFDDGSTSESQFTYHDFTSEGIYKVTVTVSDAFDPLLKVVGQILVNVISPPDLLSLSVNATPVSGTAPVDISLTVNIISELDGPFEITCNYGDLESDTITTSDKVLNFTHTFQEAGTYQISIDLTSPNEAGTKLHTVQSSVDVLVDPSPPSGGGNCFIAATSYEDDLKPAFIDEIVYWLIRVKSYLFHE